MLEHFSKTMPLIAQYPMWVQAIFFFSLFFCLTSVFLAFFFYPGLRSTGTTTHIQGVEIQKVATAKRTLTKDTITEILLDRHDLDQRWLANSYKRLPDEQRQLLVNTLITKLTSTDNNEVLAVTIFFAVDFGFMT